MKLGSRRDRDDCLIKFGRHRIKSLETLNGVLTRLRVSIGQELSSNVDANDAVSKFAISCLNQIDSSA